MKVSILVGANAYACIDNDGVKTDIRLYAGRSPSQSLCEYAKHLRQQAADHQASATLAEVAADALESRKVTA